MKCTVSWRMFSRRGAEPAEVQAFFPPYGILAISLVVQKDLTTFNFPAAATSCGPPVRTRPSAHTVCGVRSDATRRGRRGYFARRAQRETSRAPGPSGDITRTYTAPPSPFGGRCSPVAVAASRRPQQVAALPHAAPHITSWDLSSSTYIPSSPHVPRRMDLVHASSVKRRGGGRGWAVFEHTPQACERNRPTPSRLPGARYGTSMRKRVSAATTSCAWARPPRAGRP